MTDQEKIIKIKKENRLIIDGLGNPEMTLKEKYDLNLEYHRNKVKISNLTNKIFLDRFHSKL